MHTEALEVCTVITALVMQIEYLYLGKLLGGLK